MNHDHSPKSFSAPRAATAVLVSAVMMVFGATSFSAEARNRSVAAQRTGPAGQSIQRSANISAANGSRSATRSVEGPAGRGATRQTSRTYDPTTQTVDRNVTTETNNGGSFTRGGSATANGDGTISSSGSAIGPYGRSATRSGTTTVVPGGASSTATTTGPNGNSATRDGNVSVTP